MRASATTLEPEITPAEMALLVASLLGAERGGRHLEIGTAAGGTLREMLRAFPADRRPPFTVVDPMSYFPDQMAIVRRNLESAGLDPDQVDFRVMQSWPAFQAAVRRNERFSFIFVDGSHKLRHVTEDLCWSRLLEPGGLICFHDYVPRMPGVVAAVDRFLRRYPNYTIVDRAESLLVVRKTAPSATPEITFWDRLRAQVAQIPHQLAASREKRRQRGETVG